MARWHDQTLSDRHRISDILFLCQMETFWIKCQKNRDVFQIFPILGRRSSGHSAVEMLQNDLGAWLVVGYGFQHQSLLLPLSFRWASFRLNSPNIPTFVVFEVTKTAKRPNAFQYPFFGFRSYSYWLARRLLGNRANRNLWFICPFTFTITTYNAYTFYTQTIDFSQFVNCENDVLSFSSCLVFTYLDRWTVNVSRLLFMMDFHSRFIECLAFARNKCGKSRK